MRMRSAVTVESGEEPDPRIRLALSIAEHRRFCSTCGPTIDEIVLALLGATLEDLRQLHQP